jgi:alpha-L-fucosidase
MKSYLFRIAPLIRIAAVVFVGLTMGVVVLMRVPSAAAEEPYKPSRQNLEARRWFQDAKFGMFIHWGVYSVLGDGEWVMNNKKIPVSEYEKLAPQFNPSNFNAAELVGLAKAAGMKYITITSKHHDGFAMFGSKVSDYDIVDRTPYHKDPIKMLADECHKQGIKLFFYYSELDWHNPDYYPRGRTGRDGGRPETGDWQKYLDYMNGQLRELLTNYGEIGGIWFDGWWDRPDADWQLSRTYGLIHSLQPGALVGNNHHRLPFAGEDFQMFEKDLPGKKTAEFNKDSEVGTLPLETCETMNRSWGYNENDKNFKSSRQLVQYLVSAAGANANFLLNIGPKPDGTIQTEFVTGLKDVGGWLAKNGEAIYGTRGGPVTPRPWGVTTQKGNKVYVHILNWQDPVILLPSLPQRIVSGHFLKDGSAAQITASDLGVLVKIPETAVDEYDTILVLDLVQSGAHSK